MSLLLNQWIGRGIMEKRGIFIQSSIPSFCFGRVVLI